VGGLVCTAHLLAMAALWVRTYPDISKKYNMGGISKGLANTLARKKYTKN
jgi:hypothetical protein